jgi:hypothetical protein
MANNIGGEPIFQASRNSLTRRVVDRKNKRHYEIHTKPSAGVFTNSDKLYRSFVFRYISLYIYLRFTIWGYLKNKKAKSSGYDYFTGSYGRMENTGYFFATTCYHIPMGIGNVSLDLLWKKIIFPVSQLA